MPPKREIWLFVVSAALLDLRRLWLLVLLPLYIAIQLSRSTFQFYIPANVLTLAWIAGAGQSASTLRSFQS